jgi:hypothetical protein
MQNLTAMRLTSKKNGNSGMTLDEINAEIKAVRKKRKGKAKAYWNKIIEDIQDSNEVLEGEPERIRIKIAEDTSTL